MASFENLRNADDKTASFINTKTLFPLFGRLCTFATDTTDNLIKFGKLLRNLKHDENWQANVTKNLEEIDDIIAKTKVSLKEMNNKLTPNKTLVEPTDSIESLKEKLESTIEEKDAITRQYNQAIRQIKHLEQDKNDEAIEISTKRPS